MSPRCQRCGALILNECWQCGWVRRLAAVAAVAVLLVLPAGAQADYRPSVSVQDEAAITCGTRESRAAGLGVARLLSADTVRINAYQHMEAHFGCEPVEAARAAHAAGFRVHITVIGDLRWARYLDRKIGRIVGQWSVWNEPNIPGFWKGPMRSGKMSAYRRLYVRMARVLRRVDPGSRVLMGEIAPGPPGRWLSRFAYRRRTVHTHGFAIHPYTWHASPGSHHGLAGYLRATSRKLRQLARKRKLCRYERTRRLTRRRCRPVPVYVTEFGWMRGSNVERRWAAIQPAGRLVRWAPGAWRVACRHGVKQMNHYQLFDAGQAAWDTGLFDRRRRPRPEFGALAGYLAHARGCKGRRGRASASGADEPDAHTAAPAATPAPPPPAPPPAYSFEGYAA